MNRDSSAMTTRWVAPGDGCLLIDLIFAAISIAQQPRHDGRWLALLDDLRVLRDGLEALGHGPWGPGPDLRQERCELALENVSGTADTTDAGRVREALSRAVARYEKGVCDDRC